MPFICEQCGTEIGMSAGFAEEDGIQHCFCLPCGRDWEKKTRPETFDPKHWAMLIKMMGDNKPSPPDEPIPHDFQPGDLVVDKEHPKDIFEVRDVGGNYLYFHTPRMPVEQVGKNFRGQLCMGRVDGFRHATKEEIRNM